MIILEPKCDLLLEKHETIATYQKHFSKEAWDKTYKFCCIREPHERFLSYYLNHVIFKDGDEMDLARFEEKVHPNTFKNWFQKKYCTVVKSKKKSNLKKLNKDIYNYYLKDNQGKIDFDFILDFENLKEDLYFMIFDFIKKNKDVIPEECKELYVKIHPLLDFEKKHFTVTKSILEGANPSKSQEEAQINKIKSILRDRNLIKKYFKDNNIFDEFGHYNIEDIELYFKFKNERELNRINWDQYNEK